MRRHATILKPAQLAVIEQLLAGHSITGTPVLPSAPSRNGGPDRLLTAAQTAQRLGVAKRWIYRKADELPFTRRLTEGTLRFSERGLERWKESRA